MKKLSICIALCLLVCVFVPPPLVLGQFYFMGNEKVGQNAPDFTLKTVFGGEKNFNQYREGKKSIIFFWATWCPHCRQALKELNLQYEKIVAQDIKIVLVDLGEDEATVKKYMDANKIPLDVFLDSDSQLADQFALIGVPTFIFVNEQGVIKDVQHSLPEDLAQIFG